MKLVLFDIDGTLLSSSGAGRRAMEAALSLIFGSAGSPLYRYDGKTDRQIVRELMRAEGHDDERKKKRVVREDSVHGGVCLMSVLYFSCASSPGFGARYSLECVTIRLVASNNPSRPARPSTITPMPSRNICGGAPTE